MSATAGASGARKSAPSPPPCVLNCHKNFDGKEQCVLTVWLDAQGAGRATLATDGGKVVEERVLAANGYFF
jgi:hypothetical protein